MKRPLIAILATALVACLLIGCGDDSDIFGGNEASAQKQSTTPAGAATKAPTQKAAATKEPTELTDDATPAAGGDIAEAIGNLTSYKFTGSAEITEGSTTSTIKINATFANGNRRSTIELTSDGETQAMGFAMVDGKSWTLQNGTWVADLSNQTAEMREELLNALYQFVPKPGTPGMKTKAETLNGVKTIHYSVSAKGSAALQMLADMFGGEADAETQLDSFSTDAWIATDLGYPVRVIVAASGPSDGKAEVFKLQGEMTNVNDKSLKVDPPQ